MISRANAAPSPAVQATFTTSGKVKQTVYNVRDYGATGNTRIVADGAITSGLKVLTSLTANFTTADIGKLITVKGAGVAGAILGTSIASFNSSTSVTLTASAGSTVSAAVTIYGTDDLAAINLAIAAATPTGGTVFFPPGGYGITGSIVISPVESATKSCVVPSLIADSVPGRIGDIGTSSFLDEVDVVGLYPLTGYSQGALMVDYVSRDNVQSLNGATVKGLGLICNDIAAGMRISNTRRFHVSDIGIDHSAIPTVGASSSGGFNAVQQGGTSTAYNIYENIAVAYSAGDGFAHNAAGDDIFLGCYDLNSTGYAFKCQGFGRFIGCHYEASGQGWYVQGGNKPNMVIGAEFFGVPVGNAVQVTSSGIDFPVQFISCNFQNHPGSSPTEQAGSLIVVKNNGSWPVRAEFIGCTFESNTNMTDFIYVEAAVVTGSNVQFSQSSFLGTPGTTAYNDTSGHNVLQFWGCNGIANLNYNASVLTALSSSNKIPLVINQNDTTNNPNALNISNTGTGNSLNIAHNGGTNNPAVKVVTTGTTGGGNNVLGLELESTTATTGAAINMLWNSAGFTSTGGYGVVNVRQLHASATGHALVVEQAGTGAGISIKSGRVALAASTTATPSMNIASGTAPTSPTDGDIWFDGTNLKMRVSGSTKTFTLI